MRVSGQTGYAENERPKLSAPVLYLSNNGSLPLLTMTLSATRVL